MLEENIDRINWIWLSSNPSAIHLLKNNKNKIDWYELSRNPAIFKPILDDKLGSEIVKQGTKTYPKNIDSKFIVDKVNTFLGGSRYKRTNKKRRNKRNRKTNKRHKYKVFKHKVK